MNIVLAAIDPPMGEAWRRHCADLPGVRIVDGSILDVDCDAVVSPANSFGYMEGGIDLVYTKHFGPEVSQRLQAAIRDVHDGELPVGVAEAVPTGDERIPWLVSAPTMRVAGVLPPETVNPYLSARAALLLVSKGVFRHGDDAGRPVSERIRTVAFPGLGTGVGRVTPDTCARQMRAAIESVLSPAPFPPTWSDAKQRHRMLVGQRPVRDSGPATGPIPAVRAGQAGPPAQAGRPAQAQPGRDA